MKKVFALTALCLAMAGSTGAFAQEIGKLAESSAKTKQVIYSIPSLKSIDMEITKFESKVKGKSDSKNAAADLKALKQKYANELIIQINAQSANKEVSAVLNEELSKTNKEINNIK